MEYNDMIRPCGCRCFKVQDEGGRLVYYPLPCHCKPKEEDNE